MNHCVPDFETDENYLFPDSSRRHKKSAMGDEDIMELLWQNGQVVMQSQNQRSVGNKKPETLPSIANREIRSGDIENETTPCNMFMQEDEMVSWLHYPNDDNCLDIYNDIMYPVLPSSSSAPVTTAPLITVPPIPIPKRVEVESNQPKSANFAHFTSANKQRNLTELAPANSNKMSQEMTQSTIVESRASRVTDNAAFVSGAKAGYRGSMSSFGGAGTSSAGREPETYDLSASSSPGTGGSGASASVKPVSQKPPPVTEDRKRKGRDTDDTDCYSEDVDFDYRNAKKQSHGSKSTKRTRAAEVHNLSERRRRDRINEKMKALQELIPRCNKSDKASMLDEAIEYLKSLQMQVQMMSMGYSMVPMMFPGVQRYMPTMAGMGMGMGMGMSMGMGMGMGMDHVGMNRPMVSYPGAAMPNPAVTAAAAAAVHLSQRFPVPRFQIGQVPVMGPARSQAEPPVMMMRNSFPLQNPNQPRVPFADPYQQQYIRLHQTQLPQPQPQPQPQNQTGMATVASNHPNGTTDVRPFK